MRKTMEKLALAVCAMSMGGMVMAANDSANLGVAATVENTCAIGPGTLGFGTLRLGVTTGAGTVAPSNVDKDSGTSVAVVCTNGASATIGGGLGANADSSTRRMISGTDHLPYQLYTSADRTTALDTSDGVIAYQGTGSSSFVTIYGRVAGTDLAAAPKGSYSDTVALTINYTP
jgi:spore coat protein U-like protein